MPTIQVHLQAMNYIIIERSNVCSRFQEKKSEKEIRRAYTGYQKNQIISCELCIILFSAVLSHDYVLETMLLIV
jgi:hypothetical protein